MKKRLTVLSLLIGISIGVFIGQNQKLVIAKGDREEVGKIEEVEAEEKEKEAGEIEVKAILDDEYKIDTKEIIDSIEAINLKKDEEINNKIKDIEGEIDSRNYLNNGEKLDESFYDEDIYNHHYEFHHSNGNYLERHEDLRNAHYNHERNHERNHGRNHGSCRRY